MSSLTSKTEGAHDPFKGLTRMEKSRLIRARLSQEPKAVADRVDFFMATGEHMGQIAQDIETLAGELK